MTLANSEIPAQAPAPIPGRAPARGEVFQIGVEGIAGGFPCLPGETVLAAMIRQGATGIPVGCRGGGCGVCRVRVLSGRYRCGTMSRIHVGDAEREGGHALACRLYPQSDLSITPAPRPGAVAGGL